MPNLNFAGFLIWVGGTCGLPLPPGDPRPGDTPRPGPPPPSPARVRRAASYPASGPRGVRHVAILGVEAEEWEVLAQVLRGLFGCTVAADPMREGRPVTHLVAGPGLVDTLAAELRPPVPDGPPAEDADRPGPKALEEASDGQAGGEGPTPFNPNPALVPLLLARLHGAHVVPPTWVYRCMAAGQWVPEAEAAAAEGEGGPAPPAAKPRGAPGGLLGGRRLRIHGDCGVGRGAVARLVTAAGGVVVAAAHRCDGLVVGANSRLPPPATPAAVRVIPERLFLAALYFPDGGDLFR